ncbi:DUF2341 domain-containing protein [Thermococcus sp. AM4]|uniref:DUF2341 domain-containing protein n=1 Tax=Thermococcus sp. (strain AM4) TaxID=246969 RepID=UPI0001870311|nr:DUF2341 domain-containing protein [Thermococcus sp. AM4]EEB74849.1 hypothetical protein TAM4_794 [Thermococcus sp. AM4]
MKRRGFLLNSAVIVLLIPLLLLLATYEDVSSSIIKAQSERTQFERTYDVINFLNLEFQKALELSGKRAVVAAVDYVAVTGNFISPTYKANNTIRDFMKTGTSPSTEGYDTLRVMGKQTMKTWLSNVSKLLNEQGFTISPSVDDIVKSMDIEVALLDAFTVVIKARIPKIRIMDSSRTVVYDGPLPSNGGYIYATVDIRDLEDPFFSAITGGRYHRSIRSCKFAFPTLGIRPITFANASGTGSGYYIGRFGQEFNYNLTHIWSSEFSVTNFTIGGTPVTTDAIVLKDGDLGVVMFNTTSNNGGSSGGISGWCSSLRYRFNITIKNNGPQLTDFQIPIYLDSSHLTSDVLNKLFNTADADGDNIPILAVYDQNCNPVSFWVETWNTQSMQALLWVKVTIPQYSQITLEIYFDSQGTETKGDPYTVFDFYEDFENWKGWNQYNHGSVQQSSDVAYTGRYSLRKDEYNDPNGGYKLIGKNMGRDIILEGYVYRPKKWEGGPVDRIGLEDDNFNGYSISIRHSKDDIWIDKRIKGIPTIISSRKYWNPPEDDWYFFRMIIKQSDLILEVYNKNTWNRYELGAVPDASVSVSDTTYNTFDRVVIHGGYVYYVDSLRIRKYSPNTPTLEYSSTVENKPQSSSSSPTPSSSSTAHVYDIQPLKDCLEGMRYFAIEDGWSFFERLEGTNTNHDEYVNVSYTIQNQMGYSRRPIGLVSFMIPQTTYDPKLVSLMVSLGIGLEDNQTSTDYYFMLHYFKNAPKKEGYKVIGISNDMNFYIDPQTAQEILGTEGTCDLLEGYTCP